VRIVTKTLLDGLRNRDEISDLQRRLDVLPPDLDALYSHMIDHIDPLYTVQASQIFQIFGVASDLGLYLSILELELAVSADYTTAMSKSGKATQTMTDSEIFKRCDRMAAHLKSRCEGLLEVHDVRDKNLESIEGDETMELSYDDEASARIREEVERRLRVSWRVSYLHRTVKDFLKTDHIRVKLQRSAALPNFDPNLSLLMSYVINWKRGLRSYYYRDYGNYYHYKEDAKVISSTWDVLRICRQIKDQNLKSRILLQEFYELVSQWLTVTELPPDSTLSSPGWESEFLTLVTCNGLWKHVDETLMNAQAPPLSTTVPWLLYVALGLNLWSKTGEMGEARHIHHLTPEMVDLLLSLGAKPNAEFRSGKTIWGSFLGRLLDRFGGLDKLKMSTPTEIETRDYLLRASKVLQSLIRGGADIGSGFRGDGQSLSDIDIDSVIDDVFSVRLPEEAAILRELVKGTRESRMKLEFRGARKRPLEVDEDQPPSKRPPSKRRPITTCDISEDYSGE
jgi:hypothetical protein